MDCIRFIVHLTIGDTEEKQGSFCEGSSKICEEDSSRVTGEKANVGASY